MAAEALTTRNPDAAAIAGNLTLPPGRQVPVQQMPEAGYLEVFRYAELPDWPHVVPEIAPEGHVILFGMPGTGKSRLALALAHCVAYRRPIAGYAPDDPGRVWYVDFENQSAGLTRASLYLDEWGSIETDTLGIDAAAEQRLVRLLEPFKGDTFDTRLVELDGELAAADAAGELPRLVIVDTLQHMCFPYPDTNSQRWEKRCSGMLDALALKYRVCLLSVHHANKAGELSGSTGLSGGATAVFKLLREGGSTEGRLICDGKNRGGRDTLCLRGKFSGRWEFSDEVTAGQVATGHTQRRILDWLYVYGPAEVAAIRDGLPDVKPKTVSDLLSRLAAKGFAVRSEDGMWANAGARDHSAMVRACAGCGRQMTVVTPGQTTHPNCSAPAPERPPLPWGDGVPGDYWQGGGGRPVERGELAEVVPLRSTPAAPVANDDLAADDGPELAGVEDQDHAATCTVCGLLVLTGAPHVDCDQAAGTGERWPAVQELTRSIEAVRPRPLKWIAPAGDPRGDGPGRHHRGLPQWEAARRADRTVTGYSSRWRPLALGQLDPARLVVTLDKSQAYVAACENVPVSPAPLEHFGPFDCDPRELGAPSARKDGRPGGLAGVVLVECPAWDHPALPHPLGPKARPGEPVMVPSNMAELLWRLHTAGMIGRPVVLDSWLGPRHTGLFKPFAVAVREARAAAVHDSPHDRAIKRGASVALSQLRSEDRGAGIYRPDWHAAILAESMIRVWARARDAVAAGELLAGMGAVDEVAYVVPEDAAAGWLPAGYTVGGKWGQVRPKPVQVKAARVDLTGLDPARIRPAEGHPGHVLISGPLPLGVWVHRA